MKTKPAKTEVQLRAAVRANEQRRAERAFETLHELIEKHVNFDEQRRERELQELHMMKTVLLHAIQNQHIKDERYAQYKANVLEISKKGGY